jgi:hypothetical protein
MENDVVIWYMSWPFGTFCGCLEYFSNVGILYQGNLATLVTWLSVDTLVAFKSQIYPT